MTPGQTLGDLWGRGARDWADLMEPHYYTLYETVHDRLGVRDGTRLLDVGCGPGGAVFLASRRGASVAGLDASAGSIEVARERVPGGDFRVGDMESLPWPDASFECVAAFNSFQFARKPVSALTEARRVLGAGGKLGFAIFSQPQESQQTKIMAAIAALGPPSGGPNPFALSAPGIMESVLETAGLQLVDRGELPIFLTFTSLDTACRALMGGSTGAMAIQHSGEERVHQVIRDALEEFRLNSGEYRIQNRFHFLVAE